MQKINMLNVWLSIEIHFGVFFISSNKRKDSYTNMYDCEKSPITHELSYIGLFKFSHLSLFHVSVICKR